MIASYAKPNGLAIDVLSYSYTTIKSRNCPKAAAVFLVLKKFEIKGEKIETKPKNNKFNQTFVPLSTSFQMLVTQCISFLRINIVFCFPAILDKYVSKTYIVVYNTG